MLTEFTFDEEFFDSAVMHDLKLSVLHDNIINSWRKFGVLKIPESRKEFLISEINKLPPKFRQRWTIAFQHNKIHLTEESWESFHKYANFKELLTLNSIFKTGLTNEITEEKIAESNNGNLRCNANNFEIITAGDASDSVNFKKSERASSDALNQGSDIKQVWRDRFFNLAKYSKNISIIDRYVYQRICNDKSENRDASIKNFIRLASESGRKYNVKIISCDDDDVFKTSILDYFRDDILCSPPLKNSIGSITLIACSHKFFQDVAHERFIKFDSHVCNIGYGMQIFEKRKIPLTEITIKPLIDTSFPIREREISKYMNWLQKL